LPALGKNAAAVEGIEPLAKRGITLDVLQGTAILGWENQLKPIVIQWKVFGGLGVATD
jgi:hypothetical protein